MNLILSQERIEAIAHVAANCRWGDENAWMEYILRQKGAIYRMKEMALDVAKMFHAVSGGSTEDGEGVLKWLDVLIQDWNNLRPHIEDMDSGLTAARAALVEERRSTEDLLGAASELLRRSPLLIEQAQLFVGRGLRRLPNSPSLAALRRAID
jgi:hypothetical protein